MTIANENASSAELVDIFAENDQNVVYNEGVQVSEIKQIELLTSLDMLTTVTTNYIS